MRNCSSLRSVGLLAIAGMLSGCEVFQIWGVENMKGLGAGPIAYYIGGVTTARSEADLKIAIAEFIARSIPKKGLSRGDAESLGMRCAPAPSTECTYSGEFWYRHEHIPPNSPDYGIRIIETIQVRLSYLKPQEMVVQVHEHRVPEDEQVNHGGWSIQNLEGAASYCWRCGRP